jgi:hypothetical protein
MRKPSAFSRMTYYELRITHYDSIALTQAPCS